MFTNTRRLRPLVATLAAASCCAPLAMADAAQAAPQYCRAWKVNGQTWFASQSNGYSLMFTLRMGTSPSTNKRVSGYAAYNRGDVRKPGGTGSQYISGGVNSDGVGSIKLDIFWSNGSSGQYNARATAVRRTSSGGLTAGLQGTTVDTSGGGGAARWYADNTGPGFGGTGGPWPMYCRPADVVR